MSLPEIPMTARSAVAVAMSRREISHQVSALEALEAAWPHLYAAALRHVADETWHEFPEWSDTLRRIADEVTP